MKLEDIQKAWWLVAIVVIGLLWTWILAMYIIPIHVMSGIPSSVLQQPVSTFPPEIVGETKIMVSASTYRYEYNDIMDELEFENLGYTKLSDVYIRFEFYKLSGEYYSSYLALVGDVESREKITKDIELPSEYSGIRIINGTEVNILGIEYWTRLKVFTHIDGKWNEERLAKE